MAARNTPVPSNATEFSVGQAVARALGTLSERIRALEAGTNRGPGSSFELPFKVVAPSGTWVLGEQDDGVLEIANDVTGYVFEFLNPVPFIPTAFVQEFRIFRDADLVGGVYEVQPDDLGKLIIENCETFHGTVPVRFTAATLSGLWGVRATCDVMRTTNNEVVLQASGTGTQMVTASGGTALKPRVDPSRVSVQLMFDGAQDQAWWDTTPAPTDPAAMVWYAWGDLDFASEDYLEVVFTYPGVVNALDESPPWRAPFDIVIDTVTVSARVAGTGTTTWNVDGSVVNLGSGATLASGSFSNSVLVGVGVTAKVTALGASDTEDVAVIVRYHAV